MDLDERALDSLGRTREAEPPRSLYAECNRYGLVVRQHQRREPEPGTDPVAASDAALPLDRDAEVLQLGDVAAGGATVDTETVGDLAPGDERLRLEELEQLEQSCGRREHGESQAQRAGEIRPI